jgi:hypothetical protein
MKHVFKALAGFQQECPVIHKGSQGYGYTFADLPTIFSVINPLLKKHGLGFTQLVGQDEIKTIIFHIESGETIEALTSIPTGVQLKSMNEFQVAGSAITYFRRYALSAILGIVTDKDADASGEQQKFVNKKQEIIKQLGAVNNLTELSILWDFMESDDQNEFKDLFTKRKKILSEG